MIKNYDHTNGWGLQDEQSKINSELISLGKAKDKATGRNLEIIEKKLAKLEGENKGLGTAVMARIQLHVLKQRMKCPSYKKFWPEYKTRCERLVELAKWKGK